MHDARRLGRVGARLRVGVLTAIVLAGMLAVTRPMGYSPICAAFEEGSLEWFIFGCWIDPPPKDPRT